MNKAKANELVFATAMESARQAANKAGDEWMEKALSRGPKYNVLSGDRVVGQLLDVCGFSYVELKDQRTAFAKWAKKAGYAKYGKFMHINHKYEMRQELGLKDACNSAAIAYFKSVGITEIRLYSRID